MQSKQNRPVASIKTLATKSGLKYNIGTEDKKDCKAVFIELKCWITSSITIGDLMKLFKKRLTLHQYKLTHDKFNGLIKAYFNSYDFAETKFHQKVGTTSYFNLEVTLMSVDRFNWLDKDFQLKLNEYALEVYKILENIEQVDYIFTNSSK